jgi:hypothetical protein
VSEEKDGFQIRGKSSDGVAGALAAAGFIVIVQC